MKVMVCDDESLARDRLKRLIERVPNCEVIAEAEHGMDAVNKVMSEQPDVVFLDIEMPGMNGLEAAEHISKIDNPPAIIFCTAYDEYAVQAFQVNAVGYLLKPVRQEDLVSALENCNFLNRAQLLRIENEIKQEGEERHSRTHVSAKTHRGIELIPIEKICYFKADQKYVTVRHIDGEVLVDETLKEFEDCLDGFVRVHRNALVSLSHIDGLDMISAGHYMVRFKGIEDKVQVSRRHVSALRKILQRL
ncbi:MAG: response regulator transcription factor [Pseudomonadales bacterium]|nr:response regulator transcription factor [Pseudomonadales bacterium]